MVVRKEFHLRIVQHFEIYGIWIANLTNSHPLGSEPSLPVVVELLEKLFILPRLFLTFDQLPETRFARLTDGVREPEIDDFDPVCFRVNHDVTQVEIGVKVSRVPPQTQDGSLDVSEDPRHRSPPFSIVFERPVLSAPIAFERIKTIFPVIKKIFQCDRPRDDLHPEVCGETLYLIRSYIGSDTHLRISFIEEYNSLRLHKESFEVWRERLVNAFQCLFFKLQCFDVLFVSV